MKFLPFIFILLCGCAATQSVVQSPMPKVAEPDLNPYHALGDFSPHIVSLQSQSVAQLSTVTPPPLATIIPLCGECQISWNPPVNDDLELVVTNYNIHIGYSSRQYEVVLSTDGETNGVIEGLTSAAINYFAITAIYQDGQQSDLSSETAAYIPQRFALHFPHSTLNTNSSQLESSLDLSAWTPRDATFTNGDWLVTATNGPQEFYREVH